MRKSDGTATYFVPDVAYHVNKFERGFTKVINMQGHRPPRHHRRVRAGPAGRTGHSCGLPRLRAAQDGHGDARRPGGEDLQARRQLRDAARPDRGWTSRDAVRFFLISRKADTEFTFDIDLALKPTTRTRCSTCSTRTPASARCWRSEAPRRWAAPTCRC